MTTPLSESPAPMPHTHDLKVWPEFFAALLDGTKTFEFRKDDREPRFAVGDVLVLHEWVPPYRAETEHEWSKQFGGDYTGREVRRTVRYVARSSPLIPDGFCCMSLGEAAITEAESRRSPSQPPEPQQRKAMAITDADVVAIEQDIGMGSGAWDMVPVEAIIFAVLNHFAIPTAKRREIDARHAKQVGALENALAESFDEQDEAREAAKLMSAENVHVLAENARLKAQIADSRREQNEPSRDAIWKAAKAGYLEGAGYNEQPSEGDVYRAGWYPETMASADAFATRYVESLPATATED